MKNKPSIDTKDNTIDNIRDVLKQFRHDDHKVNLGLHTKKAADELLENFAQQIETLIQDYSKVDRLEVIDSTGRAYVKGSVYGSPVSVKLSLQDDDRTLKIFVEAAEVGSDTNHTNEPTSLTQASPGVAKALLEARISEVNLWFGDYLKSDAWLNTHPISITAIKDRIAKLTKELEK